MSVTDVGVNDTGLRASHSDPDTREVIKTCPTY
jgi:hypothetical protein